MAGAAVRLRLFIVAIVSLALAGAAPGCRGSATKPEVVVYTSVDQVFSEPVFRAIEERTGIAVRAVYDTEETKSTGVLNRLIAEAGRPQADVFWSGDPVRPFVLMKRGLVDLYVSPAAAAIPEPFKAADGSWTGLAARARVLLVNRTRVPAGSGPRSVRDLLDPRWKGQVAIANPVFGTTTMQVAGLFTAWGDERGRAFLDGLRANDVRMAGSNGEVKRLVASGEVAFGLADTDDAHEAMADGAPIDVVYPDQEGDGTLVMPSAVVLIRGGPHPDAGRRLIDALLSPEVERSMAEHGAHMPLRAGVAVPPGVKPVGAIRAMAVDYRAVADAMERLQPTLRAWAGM
ncbi:MAG TPA: extracellular solute-binding protein [Candidatus Acidoferrum sp.]|nr:extracellular solute-binding protein [Candidatus Acidoferrum sp.]